jgi:GxxExxY protein
MNSNGADESQPASRPVIVEKELSRIIVGCFFDVYNELGYGLVESLYARALETTLRASGLHVDREYPMIVTFRGQQIGFHRVDMIVERRIVLELKSTERLAESAKRQLRSYVTGLGVDLGILLHFGPMPRFYRVLGGRRTAAIRRQRG